MLTYYVTYRDDNRMAVGGIFVMDAARGAAVFWNHRLKRWSYDPLRVVRFLDDYRNVDRYETVDRQVVEGLARAITGSSLPDEDDFDAMFVAGS